jgi:hypothetical protein
MRTPVDALKKQTAREIGGALSGLFRHNGREGGGQREHGARKGSRREKNKPGMAIVRNTRPVVNGTCGGTNASREKSSFSRGRRKNKLVPSLMLRLTDTSHWLRNSVILFFVPRHQCVLSKKEKRKKEKKETNE